jgi:hypothetical protein
MFSWVKATRVRGWPLASVSCTTKQYAQLYLRISLCLDDVGRENITYTPTPAPWPDHEHSCVKRLPVHYVVLWMYFCSGGFTVKLMKLKLGPLTCPARGPTNALEMPWNLTAYVRKKLDRAFPKFYKCPKNLHDITTNESWRWTKLFSTINTKRQISINHVRGKTELPLCCLYTKWHYKIFVVWRGDQSVQPRSRKIIIEVYQAVYWYKYIFLDFVMFVVFVSFFKFVICCDFFFSF